MSEVALQHVLRPAGDAVVLQPAETYRIAGIYSFGRGLFEREPIRGADTSYETLVRLREGELVVSKLNGWEGAVDVVPPEIAGCHVSGEYPVFSIDRERAEPAYLRWITRWPAFWERLIPRGSMVRRKRVQVAQLLQVSVPLPAIDEQRCVAARLDRARALSDRLFDRGARFERLAAALRASLLGGRHARRASTPIELGEVLRLDEHRVSVTSAATYPIVGVYSFGRGLFQRGDLEGSATSYKSLNRVGAGQVVMSRLKAWEGALASVPENLAGHYVSPEFPTFTADETRIDQRFLAATITAPSFWSRLGGGSRGIGARRERVHAEHLLGQRIDLPTLEVQARISDQLDRLDVARARRAASVSKLTAVQVAMLNREFAALAG